VKKAFILQQIIRGGGGEKHVLHNSKWNCSVCSHDLIVCSPNSYSNLGIKDSTAEYWILFIFLVFVIFSAVKVVQILATIKGHKQSSLLKER
jgi:hypothetical protein